MSAPFLTETRERFLKAILAKLPLASVREVYLFPPIKQGGVESGVAVIAADPPEAVDTRRDTPIETPVDLPVLAPEAEPPAGQKAAASPPDEPAAEEAPAEAAAAEEPMTEEAPAEAAAAGEPPAEAPAADAPLERYTVYTAHYRLTLKGPDRGKWEHNVVAEADAPLLTIETVVRGVQRRAGDVDAPDHFTNEELRAALRIKDEPAAAGPGSSRAPA